MVTPINFDKNLMTALYSSLILKYVVSDLVSRSITRGRTNAIKNIDDINIKFAQWSAVMEGNPCPYCAGRDGQIISVENPDYASCQPPAHINCVCTYTYITEDEVDGDGNPIEETWISPDEKEREQFRIFDIYNASASQLEELAKIYSSKGINLLATIDRRKAKVLLMPWSSGKLAIENIIGWEKMLPGDTPGEIERKTRQNALLLAEHLKYKLNKDFEGKLSGVTYIAPKTEKDWKKEYERVIGKSSPPGSLAFYDRASDSVVLHPEAVKNMGQGKVINGIGPFVHDSLHAAGKLDYIGWVGEKAEQKFFEEGLTDVLARKWIVNNIEDANIQEIVNDFSDYNEFCSDILLPLMVEHRGNKQKIFEELEKIRLIDAFTEEEMKDLDPDFLDNILNEKEQWQKKFDINISQKEYNDTLRELASLGIMEEEIEEYLRASEDSFYDKEDNEKLMEEVIQWAL